MRTTGHYTRTLIVPPHRPDLLVVSHGSDGNLDYASGNPATGTAIVKVFDLTSVPSGGYNYASTGYLMGYGLRNEVALAFDGNNMLVSFNPKLLLAYKLTPTQALGRRE
jgi:glucose/arabinose dehydrogenase